MLNRRKNVIGITDALALEAAYLRRCDRTAQHRVLACTFHDPSPPRVPCDVDHRRERPVNTRRARLLRVQTRLRHRDPLQLVDAHRVSEEQEAACAACARQPFRLRCRGEHGLPGGLFHLPDLLGQRHLAQQRVGSLCRICVAHGWARRIALRSAAGRKRDQKKEIRKYAESHHAQRTVRRRSPKGLHCSESFV